MRTLITPIIALSAAASAMAQYAGDLYWTPSENSQNITNAVKYSTGEPGNLTPVTDPSQVNFANSNLIFDGNIASNGSNNAINFPASGIFEVANMTVQNYRPNSGKDVFFVGQGGSGTLYVRETLSISSEWRGVDMQDTSLRAGTLNISNGGWTDKVIVRFGSASIDPGGTLNGFNKVTVDNDMTISGNTEFQTSTIQTVGGQPAGISNPNIEIGGVLNMQKTTSGDGAGTPFWGAYFWSGDVRHQYVNMGGLAGTGNIYTMTYYTGDSHDPRLFMTFTNRGVSEFAGSITSENHSKIDITMNGAADGVQILRISDYESRGLNGNIVVKSGTLKMNAELGMKVIGNPGDSHYQNGRTLTLNGGFFGAVAQIAPTGGEGDIGIVKVSDFAWNGGSLLVNFDYDTGNVSQLMVSGEILLGAADNTYRVYVDGDSLGEGDSIYDFLMWDDSANDATLQAAIDAGSFKVFVNGVEWEANFSISGSALSAELVHVVPEPAAVAAILGALALGLAMYRRRK